MNEWDSLTNLLAANGVVYPLIREAWNYIRHRRARKDSLEESVRKDLWAEIANLRAAVSDAQSTLIEWQSIYVKLLSQHKTTVQELAEIQNNFVKLGRLLNDALLALGRIEEVERNIDEPDLEAAKSAIDSMKREANRISEKAAVLYQS
jgi:hypothetical protein